MDFRKQIQESTPLFGTLLTLPSVEIAEILSYSDFDWLFIDLEHSAMGTIEAQSLLQGIADRKPTLVRVESKDEVGIRKALDIGASGIIVPQVNSRSEAEKIVSLCKYPPIGTRSVGIGRASRYGNAISNYLSTANDKTALVIQIEHRDAVDNIEEILAVDGIDAIFIGPYDLSGSYLKLGDVDCIEVVDARKKVLSAARKRHIPTGIFAGNAGAANKFQQEGYSLIAIATDGLLLAKAAKTELEALKNK